MVLLTNSAGYAARLVVDFGPAGTARPVSGELLARGAKFFFDPAPPPGKPARAGQFSFIWDVGTSQGYILSEALQGYAPMATAVGFTKLVVQAAQPVAGKIDGHAVERATVEVTATDGKRSRFEVSRARDLGGLALRIGSLEAPEPFTVTLSQVRLEPSSEKLFLPPAGFTAYESEHARLDELETRQHAGRTGGHRDSGEGRVHVSDGRHHSRSGPETAP